MRVSTWKKAIVAALGTILLGALGSGLWDLALKPSGRWMGNALLTAVTLGSSYLKDQVYIEAAKGYHEEGALRAYGLFCAVIVWMCGAVSIYWFNRVRGHTKQLASLELLAREPRKAEVRQRPDDLIESTRLLIRQMRILVWMLTGVCLLFVGNNLTLFAKAQAANEAYTYFAQAMAICRPYMDARESQLLESQFASIGGRSDYVAVTDNLKRIAASNNLKLPQFNPW
jgi:hypothetical protein